MLAELCLALAVYHEARGEPLIGQKAVAEVVMNRVASDRFPDTICGVVMQPKQFSFVSTNGWAGIPTDPDVWADAVNISQDAIGNHLDGQSYFANKAMLYYNKFIHQSIDESRWLRGGLCCINLIEGYEI